MGGRKEKSKAKARDDESIDNLDRDSTPSLVFSGSDDDDEEANQDLSLKIVEKALRTRESKLTSNDAVLPPQQSDLLMPQMDDASIEPNQSVLIAAQQEVEEIIKTTEKHESVELEASVDQIGDNMVLRKLLRGPRYFDPPDSSWGSCYNCGEEGHAAVNCTAAKRKKPCYVCGELGHAAKQCSKGQSCYICKKGGHRAKDCPEKHMTARASKSLTVCLKCGNSGHDMFSCRNDYSPDDLKEIQCYICKLFGHLCCVNAADVIPGEISCYKCGQMGHTGSACSRLQGETTGTATPTLCYRCGEEGHFARECTYSIKAGKKNSEFSNTKNRKSLKENEYPGHWSAPLDMGKTHKKKRPHTDERGFTTPKKSKRRGGWMTEFPTEERSYTTPKKSKSRGGWTMELPTEERGFTAPKKSKSKGGWTTEHPAEDRDFKSPMKFKSRGGWMADHPGEFSSSKSNRTSWSPAGTPSARNTNMYASGSGSRTPGWSSKTSKGWMGQQPEASYSQGSADAFHHRYSSSRFGNSNDDGYRRSNSASRFGNSSGEGYRRSNWW